MTLASSLLFVACNQGNNSSKVRIKKLSQARGTQNFTYNADGKLITMSGTDGVKNTYSYNGKTITQNVADSAHNMFITSTVFLNAKGLADSSSAKDERGSYLKTYKHDENGFIVESRDFMSGALSRISKSIFKDGNQTQAIILDPTEKPLVNVYFDYYNDKPNSLAYQNYGMDYLGADSKNLVKKVVQIVPKGDTVRVTNFIYHFDKDGNVSQKAAYDAHGMMVDSSTFSY